MKIRLNESQYRRIFLNEQTTSNSDIMNLKKNLINLGWPSKIISTEGKTQEEALARTILNGLRYLNNLISEKVISGSKGSYSVCIKKVPGGCNPKGSYYSATDFSELSNKISNQKIGKLRASDVVYNTDISFNFSKIQKEVLGQFKVNKNTGTSDLFPDGWWSFFKNYYGTDNFTEVVNRIKSIASYDIGYSKETLNKYKESSSLLSELGDCFSDYHCVMDLASIATLAIPGVGLAVSAGIDFINAGTYGVEAINAKTTEERNAAILAGGLTLLGGLIGGGVSQTRRILTKGSRNPKIYQYVDDVMERVNKELPELRNISKGKGNETLINIYRETANKYGLSNSDILVAHDILKDFSKIDPKVAKMFSDALTKITDKVGRGNLTKVAKDASFQKIVLQNNGDVIVSLNKYMKTKAGKEALVELGLFVVLSEVMEIPEVQKWIGEKYKQLIYSNRDDIRGLVEKEGYDWESTKELFGSDSSGEDNTLLKQAWEKGWRPEEGGVESLEWLRNHPEFQTKKFKEKYSSFLGVKVKIEVAPEDPKQRKEGVKYYPNQGWVDYFVENQNDNVVTDEEQDATSDIFDAALGL